MTIEELKNLEGSESQIKRLKYLFDTKIITGKQYVEIRNAWSKQQKQYQESLNGDLVADAKKVFGERELNADQNT